jgi:Lrp/AsnC family leucine-responsive transcriptional regulator
MPRPRLDQTDIEILKYLVKDARISQRALAREIGMSPPAIADRIARLEADGVIQGYGASIDLTRLGLELTVLVGIIAEASKGQRELAQDLLAIPEVEQVEIVTGSPDLRIRLRVRDQAHLNEVFFDHMLALPGIRHTDSSLALYTYRPANFALRALASLFDSAATGDDVEGQ